MSELLIEDLPDDVLQKLQEESEQSHRSVADIAADVLTAAMRRTDFTSQRLSKDELVRLADSIRAGSSRAELPTMTPSDEAQEAKLLEEIKKARDEMARQGVYLTEEFIQRAKRWGR